MKRNEKGFGVLGILLVICVIAVLSAAGYFVWNANKKTTNSSDTASSSQSSSKSDADQTIDAIKNGLEEINPGSTVIEKDNAVSGYSSCVNNEDCVSIPSDVYANYGQGQAKSSAVDIKIVMTDNGLTQTQDLSTESNPSYDYASENLECSVYGTASYTRITCAKKDRIAEYRLSIPGITRAVSKALNKELETDKNQSFSFYGNGNLSGVIFSSRTNMYESYLSSTDKKSWKYIGQDTPGYQMATPAACNLFTNEENALFKRSFCESK